MPLTFPPPKGIRGFCNAYAHCKIIFASLSAVLVMVIFSHAGMLHEDQESANPAARVSFTANPDTFAGQIHSVRNFKFESLGQSGIDVKSIPVLVRFQQQLNLEEVFS